MFQIKSIKKSAKSFFKKNKWTLIVAGILENDTVRYCKTLCLLTVILDLGDHLSYKTVFNEFFCKNCGDGYCKIA